MAAQSNFRSAPHSAVLSLSFPLLQQVVQRHLLPDGRPLSLQFESDNGQQQYQATLTGCLVKPALYNQCALIFQFGTLQATGPQFDIGTQQVELVCLVDLVAQQLDNEPGAFLTFGTHLVPEGQLQQSTSGGAIWPDYAGLRAKTTTALVRTLEDVVDSRLQLNLCDLPGLAPAGHDPLVLATAVVVDFAVLPTEPAHLNIYYAAAGPHHYSPPSELQPALPANANVGLLVGNEHLLRTLVLPSFGHLYRDYRPDDAPATSESDFGRYFRIRAAKEDDALAADTTLRATNTVLLLPRHTGPAPETPPGFGHVINPGDLTVEMDDQVRVSVIYTVVFNQPELRAAEAAIKIRQTYAFRLVLTGDPYDLEFEHSSLDVWGEATAPSTVFQRYSTHIKRAVQRYAIQHTLSALVGAALRYLTGYARRNVLPYGQAAPPDTAAPEAATDLQIAIPASLTLTFYPVERVRAFATTTIPQGQLPPTADEAPAAPVPGNLPVEAVSQRLPLEVAASPALAELNRLLVDLKASQNPLVDFYTHTLTDLLFGAWRATQPTTSLLYDYALDFASQFWLMGGYLRQWMLRHSGVETTANAVLARQFFGMGYAETALRSAETRRGLEQAMQAAFLPLLRHHRLTTLVGVRALPHGLHLSFCLDVSKLHLVASPIRSRPAARPAAPAPAATVAAQQRVARRLTVQFEVDFAEVNAAFDGFFASPDKPAEPDNSPAGIRQQLAQREKQALTRLKNKYDMWAVVLTNNPTTAHERDENLKHKPLLDQAYASGIDLLRQQLLVVQNLRLLAAAHPTWWQTEGFFYHRTAEELLATQDTYFTHWQEGIHRVSPDDSSPARHQHLLQELLTETTHHYERAQSISQNLQQVVQSTLVGYDVMEPLTWDARLIPPPELL